MSIVNRYIKRRELPGVLPLLEGVSHPVLQRLYASRGITSAEQLARGAANLVPFNRLKGIDVAVALLISALEKQQHIVIVGDFDADGATSTAVLLSGLKALGFKFVEYLVPNRFEYGYGLTPPMAELAVAQGAELIITVDNGISAIDGVALAKKAGVKVLITDHHLAGEQLPDADAIVNPNQPGCEFPSKAIAGVGVAFYLLLALRAALRENGYFSETQPEPNLAELLDLVALGTVADVVPLDSNNRILVYQGLMRIRSGHCRPGIQALIDVANRNAVKLTASDFGFALAPRLNAAGRLDDMSLGISCLLANDLGLARQYAAELFGLVHGGHAPPGELAEEAKTNASVEVLMSVPGVGAVTTATLLSELVRLERLTVVESFALEAPKTKLLATRLKELGLEDVLIVVEAYDDPGVRGVTCYLSRARTGGIKGALGLAEDKAEASIACRAVAPSGSRTSTSSWRWGKA